MTKLTDGQRATLAYTQKFPRSPILGPKPGWNGAAELTIGQHCIDGGELQQLFDWGYLEATDIPPPHEEEFDEETGSITRSHAWHLTDAGRAALKGEE